VRQVARLKNKAFPQLLERTLNGCQVKENRPFTGCDQTPRNIRPDKTGPARNQGGHRVIFL
jgi:hypothetical protein